MAEAASGPSREGYPIPKRPHVRRLRVYSLDPALDVRLDTAVLNQTVLEVPWEVDSKGKDALGPGPVGEYLEVIDYDPASRAFYPPLDLNNPYLVAQDGLEPSEGNPQFHQQMVYAVAMTTIRTFERALGRSALWSARKRKDQTREYVQRLRLYPHALREANAYYSPEKKALLFGYFPATPLDPGKHLPGGTVFTCLSHDIIAHETTHALLDGLHRRFIESTNPDLLAFHEAFSDLVALFQHFSHREVLRDQIARTRGDLASQNLLGQLAQEFGQATGRYGALRDALGRENEQGVWKPLPADPAAIERETEPHARGALLVAAVFDAFLSIYKSRIADLLRIASGGSGLLAAGALHPDLVNRLAGEAARAAGHILQMCVRALDYCPPVDITFGEYLRAMITADRDLVPEDDRSYRLAVVEAFRRRGIYPRDVRSLSVDTLLWQEPLPESLQREFRKLFRDLEKLHCMQPKLVHSSDRKALDEAMRADAATVHTWLKKERLEKVEAAMGITLDPQAPQSLRRNPGESVPVFEVHSVRPARRVAPDGHSRTDLVIEVTQRRRAFYDENAQARAEKRASAAEPDFWFRGGSTLLVDPDSGRVRYCIAKSILSERRLARQRAFLGGVTPSLRATYFEFGEARKTRDAEPFALLHRGWEEEVVR